METARCPETILEVYLSWTAHDRDGHRSKFLFFASLGAYTIFRTSPQDFFFLACEVTRISQNVFQVERTASHEARRSPLFKLYYNLNFWPFINSTKRGSERDCRYIPLSITSEVCYRPYFQQSGQG